MGKGRRSVGLAAVCPVAPGGAQGRTCRRVSLPGWGIGDPAGGLSLSPPGVARLPPHPRRKSFAGKRFLDRTQSCPGPNFWQEWRSGRGAAPGRDSVPGRAEAARGPCGAQPPARQVPARPLCPCHPPPCGVCRRRGCRGLLCHQAENVFHNRVAKPPQGPGFARLRGTRFKVGQVGHTSWRNARVTSLAGSAVRQRRRRHDQVGDPDDQRQGTRPGTVP
jgi:hypothetical protein